MKKTIIHPLKDALLIMLFWIICFDVHRVFFSFHHFHKITRLDFLEWLQSFVYSLRVDFAAAAILSVVPFLIRLLGNHFSWKRFNVIFRWSIWISLGVLVAVQAGEIVAYGEWNHKLTSRVFMHLANPDEVVRTANYSMIIWFVTYAIGEYYLGYLLFNSLVSGTQERLNKKHFYEWFSLPFVAVLVAGLQFLAMRGGWQQIPLNINSATYSNKAIANDLSINSFYFFGKSYLLYNRSSIDAFIPKVDKKQAQQEVAAWYNYPTEHENELFTIEKPNVVFIVLEGWSAEAVGCLGPNKGATPNFDRLAKNGLLFTNIYATSTTSEIGNSSIFSGNPAIPEVSVTMQPEKYRKLHCLNEDFEAWGFHSSYLFSGDLKYGNIGGYFLDHGFDVVKDEADFPSDLPRGKLNYFDADLYKFLLKEINANKKPFFQCAFTGSTHAPYDQPKGKGKKWSGEEADYMNALVYSDECLGDFMKAAKKQAWYKNTLFVFVADHGHATPTNVDPGSGKFYRIPLLFIGEPLKKDYRGKENAFVGSQADIAATLIHQYKGDTKRYPWSKDLLNPKAPQFAFHAIIRGFGWVTPVGNFTYYMEQKVNGDNSFSPKDYPKEMERCSWFLSTIYEEYKQL